jgi:hypothetical protein
MSTYPNAYLLLGQCPDAYGEPFCNAGVAWRNECMGICNGYSFWGILCGQNCNVARYPAGDYLCVPAAPSNFYGAANSANPETAIDWSWWDNSSDEQGFRVYENSTNIQELGQNITSWTEGGRQPGTLYTRRVKAYNGNGESTASNDFNVMLPLLAPTSLNAVRAGTLVNLYWTDVSMVNTGYEIEKSLTSGSGFGYIGEVGGNTTSFQDTISLGQILYYRVRAKYGASVFSAYSNEAVISYSRDNIELRVWNNGAYFSVVGEPEGIVTSPLRLSRNGTIFGIVLVDPNSPDASPVRIKLPDAMGGVRALMKYP